MASAVPPLFKHQKRDIKFDLENDIVFDMSDPGTGKTRVRLTVYSQRRADGAKCLLVLCPRSVMRSAWANDCRKFTPWLKTSCATAADREEAFNRPADIYITNHDAVKWLAKQPPAFFSKFSDLVIDEVSNFKHATSDRSKALAKIKKYFKKRTVMDGTPSANHVTDIWNQVNILDDGKRLGKSFFHFRASVCQPEQVGPSAQMVKWIARPGAELAIAGLLRDITIRNRFEECVDIPENHAYVKEFYLDSKHRKAYEQMRQSSVLALPQGVVSAVNAASVVKKLMQIAAGAVYQNDEEYVIVSNDRTELVMDEAEKRKHTLVFYIWKHQRDLLVAEAKKRGITYGVLEGGMSDKKQNEVQEMFQAGMYRVLFAQPQTAAHGVTLTTGLATIWASPTYDLAHFIQGNRRVPRAGQKNKTETISVIAPDTIEEKVYQALQDKNIKLASLLEGLR